MFHFMGLGWSLMKPECYQNNENGFMLFNLVYLVHILGQIFLIHICWLSYYSSNDDIFSKFMIFETYLINVVDAAIVYDIVDEPRVQCPMCDCYN